MGKKVIEKMNERARQATRPGTSKKAKNERRKRSWGEMGVFRSHYKGENVSREYIIWVTLHSGNVFSVLERAKHTALLDHASRVY